MADGFVQVPADSVGKRVDGASLDVSTVAVIRQRIVIGDNSAVAEFAVVSAGSLQVAFESPPTINNISAAVVVTGGVAISGTAQVAIATPFTVNDISRTVQVAIATPFTIQAISATTIVAGAVTISLTPSVVLAAGAANIGTLNDISRTVQVAIATPFTIQAISATTIVAGVVAISLTAAVAVVRQYGSLTVATASHGPRLAIASTSVNVALVAAPGAGLAIYVTMIAASNASDTNTRGRFGTSASAGMIQMMMAASGGGFVMQLDPPWKLSTNEALACSVKPNVSEGIFNCNFFVASADAF